ncbi:MAG: PVC-type heme-binding CxxCH protein [Gemmatimonadota bacterium]
MPIPNARCLAVVLLALLAAGGCESDALDAPAQPDRLQVLFLGDDGDHLPSERLRDVARPFLDRGIELHYTEDLDDLIERLAQYRVLLLYGDHADMASTQEEALTAWVETGGGLVAVHSASGIFPDSEAFGELVGARPRPTPVSESDPGEAVEEDPPLRPRIAEPDHELLAGFEGFESPDRFHPHTALTDDRVVLTLLDDEPHTWIRTQGSGRVFYTGWGHGEETWSHPGFHDLLERGVRWAAGQEVQAELADREVGNPFRYVVLDVPFPPPHEARLEYERTVGHMDRGANNPRWYRMQEPLDAETAISRMILPPGFRIELFAAEPDIVNPIAMNWDEAGRLWVVESVEYPYPRELWPDGGGKDRIVVAEDTNEDGRADRFTTFADDLNIPTAIAFSGGGVIVHQAPETLFLKDTTGDGRADVREVLLEGWPQWDTHAGPSNLHYGLDNWMWGTVGYAGMDGTVGGERHEFRMGVYRFRPDGSRLEFLGRTNNNTWGLGFNEEGEAFISTANANPSTHLPIPRRHYDLVTGLSDPVTHSLADTDRIITLTNLFRQVDWVGRYTSATGHGVYTARTWPREYWNRIGFVNEPTGQLVGEFILEPDGSTYRARHPRNLVTSDDEWFSPVIAEVGPDGHVWIADWYNYILQHNRESVRQEPVTGNAYANPLRDREHGRIYRIVHQEAAPERPFSLEGASPAELVRTLAHENLLWRKHAQRLLVERGEADVVPSLLELVSDPAVDEVGVNPGAIHALWTLEGLGRLEEGVDGSALAAAVDALDHRSPGVRSNAVRVLPQGPGALDAILAAGILQDPDPQVRLAGALALADHPAAAGAGSALFELLSDSAARGDRWLRTAAALAGSAHAEGFLAAAAEAGIALEGAPEPEEPAEASLAEVVGMIAADHPEVVARIVGDPGNPGQ